MGSRLRVGSAQRRSRRPLVQIEGLVGDDTSPSERESAIRRDLEVLGAQPEPTVAT
jgi:hypothetical protein